MHQIIPRSARALPLAFPLVLLSAALLSADADAASRFVSPCGNDGWTGTAQACLGPLGPKRTVQAAINASVDGDTIFVLAGTYSGAIDLDGKAIHIVGLAGPGSTVLDAGGADHTVTCTSGEGSDTIIEGVRITGGNAAGAGGVGGGVLINFSSPTFIDCQIVSNQAGGDGAGVSIALGNPHFESCVIAGNVSGGAGGGVHIATGNPTFLDCDIYSNVAATQGGGVRVHGGSPQFDGCAFNFNDAQHGGGVAVASGTPEFTGCGILANEAISSGGGVYIGSGTTTMEDVEIASNVANTSGAGVALAGGTLEIEESEILENIVDSPLEEPTIAHGGGIRAVNATVIGDDVLIEGNAAIHGGGVSAKNATVDLTNSIVRENEGTDSGGGFMAESGSQLILGWVQVLENISLYAAGIDLIDSHLEMTAGSIKRHDATAAAALSAYASTIDAVGPVIEDNHSAGFVALGVVTILAAGPGDVDFDWSYFIENSALGGGAVYVSDGFARFGDCLFRENAAISGGALAADDFIGAATVELVDCIFETNTAETVGGAVYVSSGVSFSSARCIFRWNDAGGTGGAIYAAPKAFKLASCRIYENTAEDGAGIFVSGAAFWPVGGTISNCLLHENVAADRGGALFVGDDTTLAIGQCTITGNVAGTTGSAIHTVGDWAGASNSIIWGNSGIQVGGPGEASFTYSIIPAFQSGPNCFSANPLFVNAAADDYRLQAGSPAIEVGSHTMIPLDPLDLDGDGSTSEILPLDLAGEVRVQMTAQPGGCAGLAVVDLGAYEFAGAIAPVIHGPDLNGDGVIDGADLGILLAAWGDCSGGCCLADLTADGVINGADLGLILSAWTE